MGKILKKKILAILLCLEVLVFAKSPENSESLNVDQIDQESNQRNASWGISDYPLAQSFRPTFSTLTRVFLFLRKVGTEANYKYYRMDIKEDLESSPLTSTTVPEENIAIDSEWCEFDFPDIDVETGEIYYIVVYGAQPAGEDPIYWYFGYPDPYPKGDAYRFTPGGWYKLWEDGKACDFCFRTYGEPSQNSPPRTPSKPSGPTLGYINVEYGYFTSSSDPNGDWIAYRFDFGNRISEWTSYTASGVGQTVYNTWSEPGTYQVRAQAKDEKNAESSWSSPLTVKIYSENIPPDRPSTPSGPVSGKVGYSYTYSTSTTDADGDQIYYLFDWGDGTYSGWEGPYLSGETASATHAWNVEGTYPIRVKAKDDPNGDGDLSDGTESNWSDPLSVTIPRFSIIIKFARYFI
jgi:hypothetical protein